MILLVASVTAKGPGGIGGVPCRPVHHALGGQSARNFAHNARGGKSNQFKTPTATESRALAVPPRAGHLTKAVAYLGGGSVTPTESPLFLQINHHSQPLKHSVRRGSEIGMGEIACPKIVFAVVQK